jgi:hypothetical protein
VNPLAYGYVLALDDTPAEQTERDEAAVIAYAERKGYRFAETYFEWELAKRPGLRMLIAELRRTGAEYVIVPSPAHLGAKEAQQNVTRRQLSRIGRVTVVVLGQDEGGVGGRADG